MTEKGWTPSVGKRWKLKQKRKRNRRVKKLKSALSPTDEKIYGRKVAKKNTFGKHRITIDGINDLNKNSNAPIKKYFVDPLTLT